MSTRIGVDTGGTHTDIVLIDEDDGLFLTVKVPTTPADNSIGVLDGLEKILSLAGKPAGEVTHFGYGTTVVTNLLIQRDADTAVALIATEGFRDVLEIGRGSRGENVYDIGWAPQPPLVPRNRRYGVAERIDASGEVVAPLDEAGLRRICASLRENGVESVAIAFVNAYANPAHEARAAEIVAEECPDIDISTSSDVARQFREYERTSTTAVNAYVRRPLTRHLTRLSSELRSKGTLASPYIMRANGGLMTFDAASRLPVAITHSGPTAGIIAGATLAAASGLRNVITFDMGGTSSDVSLISDGRPLVTSKGNIEGWPVVLPMLDLVTVGAGGGSIAWLDELRNLKVGPRSAGSVPGPACYDQGGIDPTITDCNIVLGRLNPEFFLAGARKLKPELSVSALRQRVAEPLGLSLEAAALGVIAISESHMVNAVKQISVQRGLDPRDFALIGFGGAGPLHAISLATELDIDHVLVPLAPGNFSAMGQLAGNIRHDLVQTKVGMLDDWTEEALRAVFDTMLAEGGERLAADGVEPSRWRFIATLDLCYRGQNHELSVPVPVPVEAGCIDRARQDFHEEHRRNFGYASPDKPIKLVNLRLAAIGLLPELRLKSYPAGPAKAEPVGSRKVVLGDGQSSTVPIFRIDGLGAGARASGPVIIEYAGSTLFVPAGWQVEYDAHMTAHARRD